jgi:hypothetical protein
MSLAPAMAATGTCSTVVGFTIGWGVSPSVSLRFKIDRPKTLRAACS